MSPGEQLASVVDRMIDEDLSTLELVGAKLDERLDELEDEIPEGPCIGWVRRSLRLLRGEPPNAH